MGLPAVCVLCRVYRDAVMSVVQKGQPNEHKICNVKHYTAFLWDHFIGCTTPCCRLMYCWWASQQNSCYYCTLVSKIHHVNPLWLLNTGAYSQDVYCGDIWYHGGTVMLLQKKLVFYYCFGISSCKRSSVTDFLFNLYIMYPNKQHDFIA